MEFFAKIVNGYANLWTVFYVIVTSVKAVIAKSSIIDI